ncbi:MAG: ABC transporter permease [Planctomycetota bacterium]|jgi:tungstate transport system permease protein
MTDALREAGRLLRTLDADLLECVQVSLVCSVTATALAVAIGTPLAVGLGRRRFPGRRALLTAAHTGMAVPTVVIGIVIYSLLSRTGPLGPLGLLYTRRAIVLGEFALALPIIVALFSAATAALDAGCEMTARTLGAGWLRTQWTVIRECKVGLVAATMSAFGRVVSELGIAMMVGGNIRHYTRTMTTAVAVETAGGQFALALALGLILLLIALGINVVAQVVRLPSQRRHPDVL